MTESGSGAEGPNAERAAGPDTERRRLLIVANAPSANTRTLFESVVAGARDEHIDDVDVVHLPPLEAGPDDVLACHAILLGTTENFGYMAGATKDFLERVYHPCLERTQGLPWALWVRAGNDGTGATESVTRIVTGLRWKAVRPPLVLAGDWQDRFVDGARELGLLMGASLDAGVI